LIAVLEIKQLNVAYDGSQILRNVSLNVAAHQVVCLMGRNGVGKTTTLKGIVGLLKPLSGVIALDGEPLDRLRPELRARKGLGYVPQGRDIFPNLTVWENLKIGLVVHGKKSRRSGGSCVGAFSYSQGNAGGAKAACSAAATATARDRTRVC